MLAWPDLCYCAGMAISTSHPPYAMAVRHNPGWLYGVAFILTMAVIALAFLYFVGHDFFLIHVPQFEFRLPDLHLSQ